LYYDPPGGYGPLMFSAIVVGTDGSDTADRAVSRAAALARLSGALLHLLSAYSPAPVRVAV
jgi:nucleotide-binding universal stress UspA family protein